MADKVLSPKEFMEMEHAKDTAMQIKEEVERTEDKPEQKDPGLYHFKKAEVKMEDYIEMRCYIKYNLYYGQPRHLIIQALLENGWERAEIDKAFAQVEKPRSYHLKTEPREPAVVSSEDGFDIPVRQDAGVLMPMASEDDIPVPPPPQSR